METVKESGEVGMDRENVLMLSGLDAMLKSVREISAFAVMAGKVRKSKIDLGRISKALWYSSLSASST